jgi:mono/diheme cytochrome c family protein
MILGNVQTTFGAVILALSFVIAIVYAFVNIRQSRAEVGSEIELAANRKPYLADDELEGRKLDRTLTFGLIGLFIVGLGLPLYWLAEPGRQEGAVEFMQDQFAKRGEEMFATTAKGGFNCAFCHGENGEGGAAPYTITDADGRFVAQVDWKAPALNTVLLRYSRQEVRYVLTYGRPFSPMPAWGVAGGGPLNDQQLQNLIDYLETIQLTPKESQAQVKDELAKMMKAPDEECRVQKVRDAKAKLSESEQASFNEAEVDTSDCPAQWKSEGEALFNMGYYDGFAGGAYSCGRCHTKGWSYEQKTADGDGAMGPPLTNVLRQFPGAALGLRQQRDFVCLGSNQGQLYGSNGQGTGRMPGFCITPEEKDDPGATGEVGVTPRELGSPEVGGMLTQDDVQKIVEYERSLAQ